jgi:hypothetical protein
LKQLLEQSSITYIGNIVLYSTEIRRYQFQRKQSFAAGVVSCNN